MSNDQSDQSEHPNQSPANNDTGPNPELLDALSGVEQQLEIIRTAHKQQAAWQTKADETSKALAAHEHTLSVREKKLADAQENIATNRHAIDADLQTLSESEQALSERASELDTVSKSFERQRAELESRSSQIEVERTELNARTARLDHENKSLRRAREAAAEEIGTLQSQIATLEGEIAEQRTRGESLSGQLLAQAENDSSLTERCKAQSTELGVLRDKVQNAQSATAQVEHERDETQQQLATFESQLQDTATRIDSLKQELSQARLELETARRDGPAVEDHLKSLHEQIAQAEERAGNSAVELDQAHEECDRLRTHTQQLEQDYDEFHTQLEEKSAASAENEWTALRRNRLQRVRHAINTKQDKLQQATELLRERYEQAEKIISQRDAVQKAKKDILAARSKLAKRIARTKSFSFVFYFAGMLGILAGLSWAVADKFVPQKYVSTSLLVAESRGRVLTETDMTNWQRYHNSLALSPEFMEFASTRMARKGYTTLGKPGDLRAYLDAGLDIRSPLDGTIEFELVGDGAARTADILNTYVAAFQSRANQARELRTDGAATIVRKQPSIATAPIQDTRPMFAASVFGGSSLVALIIGSLLWRRMSKTAMSMDHELSKEIALIENGLPEWENSLPQAA